MPRSKKEHIACCGGKKVADGVGVIDPPLGFKRSTLPFENVPIAYDNDGKCAYFCQHCDNWNMGCVEMHKEGDEWVYKCFECHGVLSTVQSK